MISIARCRRSRIQPLRALFLQELNAQVRYDAAHARTGAAHYAVRRDGLDIGYGALMDTQSGNGTVFEFYVLPPFRSGAPELLRQLTAASNANALECQTNDRFYSSLVRALGDDASSDTILFAAEHSNQSTSSDGVFRPRRRADRIFAHEMEPVGDFVIDVGGEVVATGGFLLHYNPPFADLFMEVRADT